MCQDKGEFLLCSRNGLAPSCLLVYSVICQHVGCRGRTVLHPRWGLHGAFLSDPRDPLDILVLEPAGP